MAQSPLARVARKKTMEMQQTASFVICMTQMCVNWCKRLRMAADTPTLREHTAPKHDRWIHINIQSLIAGPSSLSRCTRQAQALIQRAMADIAAAREIALRARADAAVREPSARRRVLLPHSSNPFSAGFRRVTCPGMARRTCMCALSVCYSCTGHVCRVCRSVVALRACSRLDQKQASSQGPSAVPAAADARACRAVAPPR